jgi:MFS family permease
LQRPRALIGAKADAAGPPVLSLGYRPVKAFGAGTFRSLRIYNYRVWAGGSLVSNIGSWMQRIAQDWLVLTELTEHSAAAVGVTTALQFAPQLLLLPWTGLAADRFDQRRVLLATQTAMGLLATLLGVLTVTGVVTLWMVYVFAFAFGCAAAFDAPVRQSFVGQLVPAQDLANAVALNSTSFNSARMVGPAVAGMLIAGVGTGWAFLLNGASFVAVLASLLMLRPASLLPSTRAARKPGGFAEGFRYVRSRPDLLAICLMLFVLGTFGMNFAIWTSAMAVKVFHTDAHGYGVLSSTMAIGTVGGALLAAGREKPGMIHLLVGSAVFAVGALCASLAPGYWSYGAALALVGISLLTVLNSSNALMQLTTPPELRGRVMAIRMAITLGGTPLGSPIAGWLADRFGPRVSLGMAVVAGVVATVVAAAHMLRGRRPPVLQQATIVRGDLVDRGGRRLP